MEEKTLSSGVTVETYPFPGGLYSKLLARAIQDYPDPEPPTKTVETFDGTEEVDDLTNPDFVEAKGEVARQRQRLLAEAILDLCVKVNLEAWKNEIDRVARYTVDPPPKGPDELKEWFFDHYAFRIAADYEMVTESVLGQTLITDEEVRARLEFFRRSMEGPEDTDDDAPGTPEVERVDVQREAEES